MKTFFIALFFPVLLLAQTPKAITIGFIPGGDIDGVKKGSVVLAENLQKELAVPVNVYISKDYVSLIEAMKSKKVDFAFFNSLTFVYAEKMAGAKVLLKQQWQEPFYFSVLMVSKKSGIKSVKDLKGKRIAFVDEKSSSGFLYPQVFLKKSNFDLKSFKEIKYTGSHSASVALFDKGEVDAIAIFSDDKEGKKSALVKYSQTKNPLSQVKILWASEPIPNEPFTVRQDFYDSYPKFTHSLMFALIDTVDKLKGNKEIQSLIGAEGLVMATSRQYDPVREMVKELDIKL